MSNFLHRIRRLTWKVNTNSTAEAFAVRQNLYNQWQDILISAFESAFDEIDSGNRVIHIPKLEVNLKVKSSQEIWELLPELIQQQLNEQLQSINWQTTPTTQSQAIWNEATVQQSQFATLVYYLQTGSLPWQAAQASALEIAVELKETCIQQRSHLINYLTEQPQTPAFYFRLLQLLPNIESLTLVNTLLDRLSLAAKTAIAEFISFVLNTSQSRLNPHIQWQIVAAFISECLRQKPQQQPEFSSILDSVLSQAGSDRNAFINLLPAAAASLFAPQPSNHHPATSTFNHSQELTSISTTEEISRTHPPKTIESPSQDPLLPSALRVRQSPIDGNRQDGGCLTICPLPSEDYPPPSQNFPVFVNYAGLVLIHPFINSLFAATGVKEANNKAIADSQIPRAAALLHFLATGQTEVYEYELGFIKILLGLKHDTPILVGEGLLQQRDSEEAEAVLQSVINYWTVLKSTSIEGLRSSFLQRSGLLRKADNGWSLQVEHHSFDMLLEHLPWSISIIKLSCMKQPLYTEWRTF
ncbi:contractile injection system tape measure protein [Calothrix sp. NIES-2098]|uniref:contractile injection system tape measure protein n=1 Tax=Calothrix sp. NIES-2098 TaxID=1954171 RepID=UPI000B5F544D|nr:hypothetical protein NIES2098_30540 [Calothrix sp. NIES-2098]